MNSVALDVRFHALVQSPWKTALRTASRLTGLPRRMFSHSDGGNPIGAEAELSCLATRFPLSSSGSASLFLFVPRHIGLTKLGPLMTWFPIMRSRLVACV